MKKKSTRMLALLLGAAMSLTQLATPALAAAETLSDIAPAQSAESQPEKTPETAAPAEEPAPAPALEAVEGQTVAMNDGLAGINGCDFTVEGGDTGDYSFADTTLTITQSTTPITIRMASGKTTTAQQIVVSGGTADSPVDLTLDGVNIQTSGCAFALSDKAVVNLTLMGENTLKSGDFSAGIRVPSEAAIVIGVPAGGNGKVFASSKYAASGIGNGTYDGAGSITINGGNITAQGGEGAAGIGSTSGGATVIITGGVIHAIGGRGGAGIGNGGYASYIGGGVKASISGGFVTAIGGEGANGIGAQINATLQGTFTTSPVGDSSQKGNPVIVASSIPAQDYADPEKGANTQGIIILTGGEKPTATLYGSPTPTDNFTLPDGVELTIPDGQKLTIKDDVVMTLGESSKLAIESEGTLANNGTVENTNGTIDNQGKIEGTAPNGGTINSALDVSVSIQPNSPLTYGTPFTISATAKQKASDSSDNHTWPTEAQVNLNGLDFSGKVVVENPNDVLTATLQIDTAQWKAQKWNIDKPNTISVVFPSTTDLLESTGTAALTVNKATPAAPVAPTASSIAGTSLILNTVAGQKYIYTAASSPAPAAGAGEWQPATGTALKFIGLTPETTYYFWTYKPSNTMYDNDSPVSSASAPITTTKDFAGAKSLIEAGTYTMPQTTANAEPAVKNELARQINALAGMADTKVVVNDTDITISNFQAAVAGTADNDDRKGKNGSFNFEVILNSGSTAARKSGSITASDYEGLTNTEAIGAAKKAIEGGGSVTVGYGAGQTRKNAAVLAFVKAKLSGDAAGVDAVASPCTTDSGKYTIVLTKGTKSESIDIPMVVYVRPAPATPAPSPSATPTASPTAKPTPTAAPTPSAAPTAKPTPTAAPSATPAPTPSDKIEAFVTRLYTVCMDRVPGADELAYWVDLFKNAGTTGSGAAQTFIFGQEFSDKNYCNTDFVKRLYRAFMARDGSETDVTGWVAQLEGGKTREEVFNGFALSSEFGKLCAAAGVPQGGAIPVPKYGTVPHGPCPIDGTPAGGTAFIERLYKICLGRDGSADEIRGWTSLLWDHSKTGRDAAFGFVFSEEFTGKKYGNTDFVKQLYRALMGREFDAGGLAVWVAALDSGKQTRQQVFDGFAASDEFTKLCQKNGIVRG